MSRMKLVDTVQLEQGLTSVADAIREVAASEEQLAFPDGFSAAIRTLTGGPAEGENLLDLLITGGLTSYSSEVEGTLIDSAFKAMKKLVSVSLPNITRGEAYGFFGCVSLTEVDMPRLGQASAYMFGDCTSLRRLVFPAMTFFGPQACLRCTSLEYVDLGEALTVYPNSFKNCTALTTLILRHPTGCEGATADAFVNFALRATSARRFSHTLTVK